MSGYKNYLQRVLEAQTIYKGTQMASPSTPGHADIEENLGAVPGGEGVFASQADGRVWDNIEDMMSYTDPGVYELKKRLAQGDGPAINEEIQQIDSQFRELYWKTEPMVAGDPVLMSKLTAFARVQSVLNERWLNALRDFNVYVDDLEIIAYQYRSIYSGLLKFNALL